MATEKDPAGDDGGNKTNPPARRKKSQKRRRKWLIRVTCVEQEFNDIAAAAKAARLSKSAFGRLAMLGKTGARSPRIPAPDEKLLREIKGLEGKYGSNMNQIAYNGNAGNPVDLPELRRAIKEWGEIRDLINKALGEYAGPGKAAAGPEPKEPKGK